MKFCAKCGCELEEGQSICHQCGYDIKSRNVDSADIVDIVEEVCEEENLNNDETDEKGISLINIEQKNNDEFSSENNEIEVIYNEDNYNEKNRENKLSKKAKIAICAVLMLSILLGISYAVGKSLTNPLKVVLKFQKAIVSNNKEDLTNVLYCEDNRIVVDEKSITSISTYFKDNPSFLNSAIQDLSKDAIKLEKFKDLSVIKENNSQNILNLIYVGKKWGVFPDYKISIKPTFIEIRTSIKDVVFSLNNKEIGKSDSDNFIKEYGPFMPGKYKLLGNYKGKYIALNESYDVDTVNNQNGKVSIDVLQNLNYVRIDSQYPEAKLFVDGKDAGVKVKDTQNFGPLSSNTKLYATTNKNGTMLKSNEFIVGQGDNNIYLDFSESENLMRNTESQLNDLMRWYTESFTQAVNMNDFSIVESYIYPGSKLYVEQQKYIPSTYERGIKENILSLKIVSYSLSDNNKSGSLITEEVYNIDNNGTTSVKNFKYKYTFAYNELTGSYQLESIAQA